MIGDKGSKIMTWLRKISCAATLLASALLVGCGGAGGSDSGIAGGGSPDLIPAAERQAAIRTFNTVADAAFSSNPTTALDVIRSEAGKHTLTAKTVKEDDGTITVEFKDGTLWAYVNNRFRTETPASPGSRQIRSIPVPGAMPLSEKAAVFCSFDDPSFVEPGRDLAPLLTAAGYTLPGKTWQKGTLEDYENLSDLGVLYIDSHGSKLSRQNSSQYFVTTATHATDQAMDSAYKKYPKDQLATISFNVKRNGKLVTESRLALSAQWFKNRRLLKASGLAFFNTCNSGHSSMSGTFNGKELGLYLGWSTAVSDYIANKASRRFFELMLDKGGKRQAWSEVLAKLDAEGLLVDPPRYGVGAKLVHLIGQDAFDLLLPAIDKVTEDAAKGQYVLMGIFGPTKGIVYENGDKNKVLDIASWSNSEIRVRAKPSTISVTAAIGLRETQKHNLSIWRIASSAAGPISAQTRVWIYLTNSAGQLTKTIIREPEGTSGGAKGPYYFFAEKGHILQMHVFSDAAQGSCSSIYLTSPSGAQALLINQTTRTMTPPDKLVATSGGWPINE